jgi:two-component system chemotaxis response regulator CheB
MMLSVKPETSTSIVAIACSAGGLQALSEVLSRLPDGFPAAVLVVQHLDPKHQSLLPDILRRRTSLTVRQAVAGDGLEPGTVLVAPPDQHLLVKPDGTISLTRSAEVHFVRPSADVLFESLARSFGERAIAVVLTGTGVDGVAGIEAIKAMGGTVIAQDQATSAFFGMPGAAIQSGKVDFVLPLNEIPAKLIALIAGDYH